MYESYIVKLVVPVFLFSESGEVMSNRPPVHCMCANRAVIPSNLLQIPVASADTTPYITSVSMH
jgi:hypothetical protein